MKKEKTIGEWFDELRPDIRDKALKNISQYANNNFNANENSLANAILGGFHWHLSFEDRFFWKNIYESLLSGSTEFLKPAEQ